MPGITVNPHAHIEALLPHSLYSLAQELPGREEGAGFDALIHGPPCQIRVVLANLKVLALGPGSLEHGLQALQPKVGCVKSPLPVVRPAK